MGVTVGVVAGDGVAVISPGNCVGEPVGVKTGSAPVTVEISGRIVEANSIPSATSNSSPPSLGVSSAVGVSLVTRIESISQAIPAMLNSAENTSIQILSLLIIIERINLQISRFLVRSFLDDALDDLANFSRLFGSPTKGKFDFERSSGSRIARRDNRPTMHFDQHPAQHQAHSSSSR